MNAMILWYIHMQTHKVVITHDYLPRLQTSMGIIDISVNIAQWLNNFSKYQWYLHVTDIININDMMGCMDLFIIISM